MGSCPNCGFDLNSEGKCTVCGYDSSQQVGLEAPGSDVPGRGLVDSEARREVAVDAPAGEDLSDRLDPSTVLVRPLRRPRKLAPVVVGAIALIVVLAAGVFFIFKGHNGLSNRPTASASLASAGQTAAPTGVLPTVGAGAATAKKGTSAGAHRPPSTRRAAGGATAITAPITRVGFSAPVGASPVSIRATHPIDLYNPAKQPVYNITERTGFPPLTSESAYVKWMLAHTHQRETFLRERWHRASIAVARHLIVHRRVLLAFLMTPREWFVRSFNLQKTYENTALPIGYGQTISGPDLVAHMTDALDPQPNQKVLEIGTGSGYQSAVLSQLSNYVYTIEIVRPLAEQTNEIYLEHTKAMPEYANIHRRLADGYYGWPAYAPFDRIIVTTGIDHIPPILLQELKPGGIMVIPIGPPTGQTILKITKTVGKNGRIHLTRKNLYPGITDIFVPFTASGGGTHNTRGRR